MAGLSPTLLEQLSEVVGTENVTVDPPLLEQYGQDWTRFLNPDPSAIVFVRDTAQLVSLVGFANEHRIGLVPSGGRTGLSGGATAIDGEIVVSFDKMNQILSFNETDQTVTVQAGLITENLQQFARDKGLFYPVDFASSGSSQIGGNIATNAGGIKVLRYGLTRQWVAGLKVVTGAGHVLELNKALVKNATGYDLRHLFIGSEGTLGFVTEATIKLAEPPKQLSVLLLAVPKMTDTISILSAFKSGVSLTAFEFFSDEALKHVLQRGDMTAPFSEAAPFYVLLEFENDDEALAAGSAFEHCVEAGWAIDGILAQSEQQNRDLWRYREDISESITPRMPYKNDVAVRVCDVPAFLRAVDEKVEERYPEFEVVWFGHIGDGNLHLNILKPDSWEAADFKQECEKVSDELLEIVQFYGGSVSAEHGVGVLKRNQLHFSRSADEIALMSAIKHSFDPNGIMNPGKLL